MKPLSALQDLLKIWAFVLELVLLATIAFAPLWLILYAFIRFGGSN